MSCPAEEPITDTPRPTKETLLPQMAALALAGQGCRQIAATFGLTKSTVNRWLQEMREDCPTRPAGCAEMVGAAVATYWKLHYEALNAFHLSLEDKVTERVVETETVRGRKKKRTVQTETHASKPVFLTAAIQAINGIARITALIAPRGKGERERERKGGAPAQRVGERGRGIRGTRLRGAGPGDKERGGGGSVPLPRGEGEREQGRKGEKERGERISVPPPQSEPVPLNALLEGEKGDLDAAEECAIEAKCPTGAGLPADAADAQLSQPDMNAGGLVHESSADENCLQAGRSLVHPPDRNAANAVKCPIREKVPVTPVPKGKGVGERIAALLDAYGPLALRQPTLFARLSHGHPRPVVLAGSPLRGDSRREELEFGFDCPIPIATRVSGRRGVLQGPLRKSGTGLQTVPS